MDYYGEKPFPKRFSIDDKVVTKHSVLKCLERMLSPQEILLTKRSYRRTAFLDLSSVDQGSTDRSVETGPRFSNFCRSWTRSGTRTEPLGPGPTGLGPWIPAVNMIDGVFSLVCDENLTYV